MASLPRTMCAGYMLREMQSQATAPSMDDECSVRARVMQGITMRYLNRSTRCQREIRLISR